MSNVQRGQCFKTQMEAVIFAELIKEEFKANGLLKLSTFRELAYAGSAKKGNEKLGWRDISKLKIEESVFFDKDNNRIDGWGVWLPEPYKL